MSVGIGEGVCEAVSVGSCARGVGVETAVSCPHPSSNKQNKLIIKKTANCLIFTLCLRDISI